MCRVGVYLFDGGGVYCTVWRWEKRWDDQILRKGDLEQDDLLLLLVEVDEKEKKCEERTTNKQNVFFLFGPKTVEKLTT